MKLLLIGTGAWGQKYISTLSSFNNIDLQVAHRNDWKNKINESPDGVIVCTPPDSHIEIASYALSKNIPTMIEKPLSLSLKDALALQQFNSIILVNHIHLFSTAYQNIKIISSKFPIDKIVSLGFNKGPIRSYSSLWDYGCHDLSMILDLVGQMPQKVDIQKITTNYGELFDINLKFDTLTSESLVGNGAAHPIRKLKIECDGINIAYNDKVRPSYHSQPLVNALNVFIDAINGQPDYRLGLDLSIKVIKILEMCDEILKSSQ